MDRKFFTTCSWRVNNTSGGDISDILVCQIENEDSASLPSKSLILVPPDSDYKPCTITLKQNAEYGYNISAIDVLCNARKMEVYSTGGEYISTEDGLQIDVLENNTKLYMLQKTLEPELSEVTLKIVSLQNKTELFLHSLHVTIVPTTRNIPISQSMGPCIDLDKVKSMLPDSGQSISARAQGLMNVMESFQKNQLAATQQMSQMAMMMSMFSSMAPVSKVPQSNPTFTQSKSPALSLTHPASYKTSSSNVNNAEQGVSVANFKSIGISDETATAKKGLLKSQEMLISEVEEHKVSQFGLHFPTTKPSNVNSVNSPNADCKNLALAKPNDETNVVQSQIFNHGKHEFSKVEYPDICKDNKDNKIHQNDCSKEHLSQRNARCTSDNYSLNCNKNSCFSCNDSSQNKIVNATLNKSCQNTCPASKEKTDIKSNIGNSESVQNMKEISGSKSNESLASYHSNDGDAEVLVISENSAVAIESSKILTMQDLKQFEKKVMSSICESEKRVKQSIEERVDQLEKNMCDKLDKIMNLILSRDSSLDVKELKQN